MNHEGEKDPALLAFRKFYESSDCRKAEKFFLEQFPSHEEQDRLDTFMLIFCLGYNAAFGRELLDEIH
jgi:hypothetical protein